MNNYPWYSLTGKKIWIFGGAGYLGSAITNALAEQCEQILCIDLPSRAAEFVNTDKPPRTIPISFDVSRIESLEDFVEKTSRAYGVPDGVVNLTFSSSAGKRLEELTATDFAKPFEESVTSFFVLARALANKMKPRGSGSFVHFASMYGMVPPDPAIYVSPQTPNPIDYGASKAAILQMNRYLAVHYGESGLRFNCIVPGPFPNPAVQSTHPDFIRALARKTPLNRIGMNSEIVGPVLFLLTDSASYVTGHSLVVDGGWTVW